MKRKSSRVINLSEQPVIPAKPATSTERVHLEFVDGIRALAALFVVLAHAWTTIPSRQEGHGTNWLNQGQLAVVVFMVVSGFCLALPMVRPESFGALKGGAIGFFMRRARRILPPYYFAMALSIALIWTLVNRHTGTHWDESLVVTWKSVGAHLLLLQDIWYTNRINYAFWSIALEWQIYFLLPLMALGWRRFGAFQTVAVAVVLSYAADQLILTLDPGNKLCWQFGYIALFAMGTLSCLIATSPQPRYQALRKPLPWAIALAVLLLVLRKAIMADGDTLRLAVVGMDFIVGLCTSVLLILACCPGKNALRTTLGSKPLVFVGTFAYSIYLVHAPLLQVVWQYAILPLHLTWRTQFLLLALIGIPMIVAACYLFFLACEKPWLARRPHETMRNLAADAAASPAP